MLCPRPLGVANEIVICDERFGGYGKGSSLAEYSQLFGLAELIKSGDIVADSLFLFQYRKFISPNGAGYDSIASWVKVLSPKMASACFPSDEIFENISNELVTGSILDFGESLSESYFKTHVAEDLVTFTSAYAESGIAEAADIRLFASIRGIIPSPTLCYVSTDLFIEYMDILKKVSDNFLKNFYVERQGYQSRSTGYLLERLHSLLICKRLLNGSTSNIPIWNRYVINTEIS